jgi:sucrose-6-phosphate hydrolase SacC (GH32 family)
MQEQKTDEIVNQITNYVNTFSRREEFNDAMSVLRDVHQQDLKLVHESVKKLRSFSESVPADKSNDYQKAILQLEEIYERIRAR